MEWLKNVTGTLSTLTWKLLVLDVSGVRSNQDLRVLV